MKRRYSIAFGIIVCIAMSSIACKHDTDGTVKKVTIARITGMNPYYDSSIQVWRPLGRLLYIFYRSNRD